jgi:hypothetical protein
MITAAFFVIGLLERMRTVACTQIKLDEEGRSRPVSGETFEFIYWLESRLAAPGGARLVIAGVSARWLVILELVSASSPGRRRRVWRNTRT